MSQSNVVPLNLKTLGVQKARDLVDLLLTHGERAYRASLPREFIAARGPGFRLASLSSETTHV
ncbi:hypothetical protein [Aureimonas psammosilenae]|uniref:hypothetical protein n=1 Tax=Aureimonas psammosilenae TaxID=2495496 RepID=UPI001260AC69|nr:hypothetical protein [Aureimonas psammosilenae]